MRCIKGKYVNTYVPWTYLFVRTECEVAYSALVRVTRHACSVFFNTELVVAVCTLNRTAYIANALVQQCPGVRLCQCYIHLQRNMRANMAKLKCADNLDYFKHHVMLLRDARSEEQFLALADLVLHHWRSHGEAAYAKWFESVYLTAPYHLWYAIASGIPRAPAHQQHIESHNRNIKRVLNNH